MDKEDLLLEQWKMASELHRHEDRLTWQRFSYFVTLTGILISGLGLVLTQKGVDPTTQEFAMFLISLFGAIVSLTFLLIFRRAYYYHIYRIKQAKAAEEKLLKDGERVLTVYITGLDFTNEGVEKFPLLKETRCEAPFWPESRATPTNVLIIALAGFATLLWAGAFLVAIFLLLCGC